MLVAQCLLTKYLVARHFTKTLVEPGQGGAVVPTGPTYADSKGAPQKTRIERPHPPGVGVRPDRPMAANSACFLTRGRNVRGLRQLPHAVRERRYTHTYKYY